MGEDQGEQPDRADPLRLVVEDGLEVGEVDLGLLAWRGLEAAFEAGRGRARLAKEVGDGGVAASVPALDDLPHQAPARQLRMVGDAAAEIVLVGLQQPRPRPAGAVPGALQPLVEVLAHGLAVEAGPARDGGYAKPLAPQIVDHDNLPQNNHPHLPRRRTRGHPTPAAGLTPAPPGGRWRQPEVGTFT